MTVNGFAREKHVAENGEGLREETERGVRSDEGIEEVGRASSGEGEDGEGLWAVYSSK